MRCDEFLRALYGDLRGVHLHLGLLDVAVGVMRRFERTVWIGGGTVLSPAVAALTEPDWTHKRHYLMIGVMAVLMVLTHVTVVWRVRRVFAGLRERAQAAVTGEPVERRSHAG